MATTKYFLVAGNKTVTEVLTSKPKAEAAFNEAPRPSTVVTASGKVVFESTAKRTINMSKPYTRVVPVPDEVVETIDGDRVAYKRTRAGFALLDSGRGDYRVWDLVLNREHEGVEVETTRDFGRWVSDEGPAVRAALLAELEGADA
jgi:hypothetical protein